MKIKQTFVTNSSTTSFIISSSNIISDRDINFKLTYNEELFFDTIKNRKELICYCDGINECDWITNVTGPKNFYYMNEDTYIKCLDEINSNYVITIIGISHHEDLEKFRSLLENKGTIIGTVYS